MGELDFESKKNRYISSCCIFLDFSNYIFILTFLKNYMAENYGLTPKGIVEKLGLWDVDYNKVSAYGHFGKNGLPWEE